jgi:epsilon-lactone hydrolase
MAGLPPMLIQIAIDETLLDDSIRVAECAGAADVSVDISLFGGAFHRFQFFTDFTESQGVWSGVGTFCDRHNL